MNSSGAQMMQKIPSAKLGSATPLTAKAMSETLSQLYKEELEKELDKHFSSTIMYPRRRPEANGVYLGQIVQGPGGSIGGHEVWTIHGWKDVPDYVMRDSKLLNQIIDCVKLESYPGSMELRGRIKKDVDASQVDPYDINPFARPGSPSNPMTEEKYRRFIAAGYKSDGDLYQASRTQDALLAARRGEFSSKVERPKPALVGFDRLTDI